MNCKYRILLPFWIVLIVAANAVQAPARPPAKSDGAVATSQIKRGSQKPQQLSANVTGFDTITLTAVGYPWGQAVAKGVRSTDGEPGKPSGGSPAMTAVATLGRQFMGWKRDHPNMTKALAYLDRSGVTLENMYYTYYATLVMFQAGGEFWNKWNKAFRDPLIDKQVTGRGLEFDGSWDTDISYGAQGGRVYSTAMSVFCLEIYYRFLPLLK